MLERASSLSPEDRDRLSQLQWHARTAVEGLHLGIHPSPLKGTSVEFKEHRPYVRGDEVRSIDWKLFGKTDRLYIRQYEEETNLRASLLLDQSGSMGYSGARQQGTSKHEFACRLAASLGYLFASQHDAVGLTTFDTSVKTHLPPRSRPAHLHALMELLATSRCGGETSLASVIESTLPKLGRRGVVFLISDGFDQVDALLRALAMVRQLPHEVVFFQVWHPDELDFPFSTRTRFRSLESPQRERIVDPLAFRAQYQKNLSDFRSQLEQGCKRQRVALVPCTTQETPSDVLAKFLAERGDA